MQATPRSRGATPAARQSTCACHSVRMLSVQALAPGLCGKTCSVIHNGKMCSESTPTVRCGCSCKQYVTGSCVAPQACLHLPFELLCTYQPVVFVAGPAVLVAVHGHGCGALTASATACLLCEQRT